MVLQMQVMRKAFIEGSAADDTITGSVTTTSSLPSWNDTITGGAGADYIEGGLGDDGFIDGGANGAAWTNGTDSGSRYLGIWRPRAISWRTR